MQSVANRMGQTQLQRIVNGHGVEVLAAYLHSFKSYIEDEYGGLATAGGEEVVSPLSNSDEDEKRVARVKLLQQLDRWMEELQAYVHAPGEGKNVDLLLVSGRIARAMHGGRTTSCKSAKDRCIWNGVGGDVWLLSE